MSGKIKSKPLTSSEKKRQKRKLLIQNANNNKMLLLLLGTVVAGVSVTMYYFPEWFTFLFGEKKPDDDDDDDDDPILPDPGTTFDFQGSVNYRENDGDKYYAKIKVNSTTKASVLTIYNSIPEIVFGPVTDKLTQIPKVTGGGFRPNQLSGGYGSNISLIWYTDTQYMQVQCGAAGLSTMVIGDTPPPAGIPLFPATGIWRANIWDAIGTPGTSTLDLKSDGSFSFYDWFTDSSCSGQFQPIQSGQESVSFIFGGTFEFEFTFTYDTQSSKIKYLAKKHGNIVDSLVTMQPP